MNTVPQQVCLAMTLAVLAGAQPPRVMGYYPAWGKTQTPPYRAANIPYAKLSHVLHAFLLADKAGDGTLNVPGDLVEPELISRAHAAGVKVSISVGGASGIQKKAFRSIAANPSYRAAFAQNLYSFVSANGYDGVDIDYEVPVTEADRNNCTLMMQAIRAEFPVAAVGFDGRHVEPSRLRELRYPGADADRRFLQCDDLRFSRVLDEPHGS